MNCLNIIISIFPKENIFKPLFIPEGKEILLYYGSGRGSQPKTIINCIWQKTWIWVTNFFSYPDLDGHVIFHFIYDINASYDIHVNKEPSWVYGSKRNVDKVWLNSAEILMHMWDLIGGYEEKRTKQLIWLVGQEELELLYPPPTLDFWKCPCIRIWYHQKYIQ